MFFCFFFRHIRVQRTAQMIVWVPMTTIQYEHYYSEVLTILLFYVLDAKLLLALIAQDLHKFVVLARFITARIIARLFLNFWTARVNVLIHLRKEVDQRNTIINDLAYKQIWISSAWNSENLMA